MRTVIIGNVLIAGLVLAGCNIDRGRDPKPTTTTAADMPAVQRDLAPPSVIAPSDDIPAPPATESTGRMIDLDSPPAAAASPTTRDDVTRETPNTRNDDTRGVGAGAGAGAGTDTGDPDRRGSSFESSGGSSGLGTYGKKVPGQERFDTKPHQLRDGG